MSIVKEKMPILGKELNSIQQELNHKQFYNSLGNLIDIAIKENYSFDKFLEEITMYKKFPDGDTEFWHKLVLRDLYNNSPYELIEFRKDLLTITKQLIYKENKYHYNEIYAIVSFLINNNVDTELLYISERIQSGYYVLKDINTNKETFIIIKNKNTKHLFKPGNRYGEADFASFVKF